MIRKRRAEVDAAVREGLRRAYVDPRINGMAGSSFWNFCDCLLCEWEGFGGERPILRDHIRDAWREQHAR